MQLLAVGLQYLLACVLVLTGILLSRATLRGRGFVTMLDQPMSAGSESDAPRALPLPSTEAALSPAQGNPRVPESR
jgi:hypothetical protein